MNILILTGSFGMGHNSSAIAIKEEIIKKYKDANCAIVDINKYMFPVLHPIIYKGFNIVVHRCHYIYNLMYKIMEKERGMPLKNIFMGRVHKLLKDHCPDLIISTLPMSSNFISQYKEFSKCKIPLITCITDISMHNGWINSNTDIYFVATQNSKDKLIKRGIDEKSIYITGIPVKEVFLGNNYKSKKLDGKKILIMGGGLGIIPLNDSLYRELNNMKNIKVTIITGKNKKIFKKLYGKYSNIDVIEYCNDVHNHMRESDIIISKPGGITLFESIYSQLPLLVICPFLEHEIENARFIEEKGIGKVVWNKKENVMSEIYKLIYNENQLCEMKSKMDNIKSELNKNKIISVIEKFNERAL